jgi:flagellar biosynthesis/type III secretory pathway chaperone
MDSVKNENWKVFHERLQASMKQEIGAMREMLANMRQEEVCLLAGDKTAWNNLMIERSSLLARLYELRSQRFQATELLESIAKDTEISFEHLLCLDDEDGCEIFTMREQLTALVEKMNQQNLRNSSLEGREYSLAKEKHSFPQSAVESVKKAKTTIATYPDKPTS